MEVFLQEMFSACVKVLGIETLLKAFAGDDKAACDKKKLTAQQHIDF